MTRALLSILFTSVLAAAVISLPYISVWVLTLIFTLSAGVVIGMPMMLLAKRRGWLSWWHAAIAGALAALPWILVYLSINPIHTELAGFRNSIGFLGLGIASGLVVWILGVFRNPEFGASSTHLPLSITLLIPLFSAGYIYQEALEPVSINGCITGYSLSEKPTSWHYADVEVITDDGVRFVDGTTIGSADPAIVGSCAYVYKARSYTLLSTRYLLGGAHAVGCKRECGSSKGA